jgi:O-antigen ligase
MAAIAPRRARAIGFDVPEGGWRGMADRTSPRARRGLAIAALMAFGAVWGAAVGVGGVAALIICLTVVACAFCLYDFRAGVAMMVVIMPISQSYVFPHAMFGITGLNPLNLLILTTLVSYVMRTAGEPGAITRFMPRHMVWLYVLPLAMGAWLGMDDVGRIPAIFRDLDMIFFDNAFGYVRDMFAKPLMFVVYALLVAAAVHHSREPHRFITPMVASIVVMALVALVYTAISGVTISQLSGVYARHFFSPLGMHANDLGRLYACAYALLLFTWDRSTNMALKSTLFLAMGMVVFALLFTFSRGAFFGFILVNIIYLFSRRHVKTLVLAALAIPLGLYLTPGAVWDRMTMGFGSGLNAISAGRVGEIWVPLAPTLLDSPIWGNGLGSIMWSRPMIDGLLLQVAHPHNAYLQAYTDMGVIGLALLLAFWIYIWRRFRGHTRDTRLTSELQGFFEGAAAALLAFLVAGVAGSSLAPVPAQAFLWLAVGMLYGIQRKLGEDKPGKER